MGQDISTENNSRFKNAIGKLTKMELADIEAAFEELSFKSGDEPTAIQKPTWLNRDKFAKMFGVNDLLVEQLFDTFDQDKNGLIDFKEFVTGVALCLHGSLKEKCRLLFKIFNLNNDDGVSPEEFSMVLTSCLQSAHAMLLTALKYEGITGYEEQLADQHGETFVVSVVVEKIVKDAFEKCDKSGNGKLEIDEFVQWVHKNPSLVNNIFVMQCPKPSSIAFESQTSVFDVIESPSQTSLLFYAENEHQYQDITFESEESVVKEDLLASEINENSANKLTLLKMASGKSAPSTVQEKSSLQELFSSHNNVESFFDAFSIQNDEVAKGVLTHSKSETFLDRQCISPSENMISDRAIAFPKHMTLSDSLQSIALSRDSLIDEDKHNLASRMNTDNKNASLHHKTIGSSVQHLSHENMPQQAEEEFEIESKNVLTDALQQQKFNVWIPTLKTQLLFNSLLQGNPLDNSVLSFPSVLVEDLLGDPVKELVARYLGEHDSSKRPVLGADQVEFDENGLKKLMKAQCWRAAIDWTTKYLTFHGQGISTAAKIENAQLSPGLLQIWFVRMALMVKLRMFSSAEAELNAFKDFESPNFYYQFYSNIYPGVEGSMVPFSFRLLYAELPQHNGRPNIALDRLYALLYQVKAVLSNLNNGLTEEGNTSTFSEEDVQERLRIWNSRYLRINYSLGNCFLRMKEYLLAIRLFEQIISLEPSHKAAILSGIGRIHLQLGDLSGAQKYFRQVELLDNIAVSNIVTINRGYYYLCQGSYEEAYKHFSDAAKAEPNNLSAVNNAAVCLLFLGRVKEACTMLETMVWRSPEKSLHEEVLLNLNTIYELETSRAVQKKYKILDLVCKNKGDNFNIQCLKLS